VQRIRPAHGRGTRQRRNASARCAAACAVAAGAQSDTHAWHTKYLWHCQRLGPARRCAAAAQLLDCTTKPGDVTAVRERPLLRRKRSLDETLRALSLSRRRQRRAHAALAAPAARAATCTLLTLCEQTHRQVMHVPRAAAHVNYQRRRTAPLPPSSAVRQPAAHCHAGCCSTAALRRAARMCACAAASGSAGTHDCSTWQRGSGCTAETAPPSAAAADRTLRNAAICTPPACRQSCLLRGSLAATHSARVLTPSRWRQQGHQASRSVGQTP
jgi:ribosomal protein L32